MRGRLARTAALGLALTLVARARAAEVRDPSCSTVRVVVAAGTSVFRLQPFVRAGSDSMWSHLGPWVRGRDYTLDPLRGDVRLLRAPAPGETLWVSTCRLLAPPPLEVAHLRYRPPGSLAANGPGDDSLIVPPPIARASTARDPQGAPAGATLALTGGGAAASGVVVASLEHAGAANEPAINAAKREARRSDMRAGRGYHLVARRTDPSCFWPATPRVVHASVVKYTASWSIAIAVGPFCRVAVLAGSPPFLGTRITTPPSTAE